MAGESSRTSRGRQASSTRRSVTLVAAGSTALLVIAAVLVLVVRDDDGDSTVDDDATVPTQPTRPLPVTGTVEVGPDAVGVAVSDDAVWVESGGIDGTVSRIDPDSMEVTDTVEVRSPSGLAVFDDVVWVANGFGSGAVSRIDVQEMAVSDVSRIDPDTREVTETIDVGDSSSGVAVSDDAVWVTNAEEGTVSRIG